LSHAETPVPPSFSACPCLNLWFYSWNCLKSCSILSLVDFFLPFDPLIFRCFPGAERLQSEPLETLAPRRFVALWRYEELRHQLRGRRRARKHLKLQPCLASPWGILDGENGSCFFFCGYGLMKLYCVIGLFFFFTCFFFFFVCVFFLRYADIVGIQWWTYGSIVLWCSMFFLMLYVFFLVVCCMFLSN
jgi:hypothetical protein